MNSSEKNHPTAKKPPTIPSSTTTEVAVTTATKKPINQPTATKTPIPSPKFQPTKPQQLPVAPRYRPRPPPTIRYDAYRRPRRRCCTGKCCFLTILWSILIILVFLILATVTAGVFYGVYRPRPPSFAVSSFNIVQFNLSSPTQFTTHTKLNLSITTQNPNNKITFYYKPTNLTLISTKSKIEIGQGSFPQFIHYGQNLTKLFTIIIPNNNFIDDVSFGKLKDDLMQKSGKFNNFQVEIVSKVSMKIGDKIKTNNFGLRVICDGFKINGAKTGEFSTEIADNKCSVHVFIMLFNWEIPI